MPTTKQTRFELYPTPELKAAIEARAARFGMDVAPFAKAVLGFVCGIDPAATAALRTLLGEPPKRKGSRK